MATGIVLLVLGLWAAVCRNSWQSWVVSLIGVWMIIAGFWFPSSYGTNLANDIAAGAVIVIMCIWETLSGPSSTVKFDKRSAQAT
jgi:thiol:disulfide interchange protein